MPLPDGNPDWPPPSTRHARKLYTRYGAWYSGDPEQLAAVYNDIPGLGGESELPHGMPGGARFTSALSRGVQRMFWGAAQPVGQVRSHKVHIPLAGDIASTGADLLFGEPPTFAVPADDAKTAGAKTQQRIETILDESNAAAVWLEGAETAGAYGGAYIRVRWDPMLAECPLFDVLPPDSAVPEWRGGRLTAVTLWRDLERLDGRHWRHLERHERGRILHGVYASGDESKLGRQMALQDHPETAPFALLVDAGDGQSITTGATGLACEYVPNVRPNREMRGSPLGRSDYSGIEPIMDALDEAWTSWMRDLRIGKGRLVVPRSYVHSRGPGRGAMFDPEREVYDAVDALDSSNSGSLKLEVVQFAIRVEEHSRTCRELTTVAVRGAGYSAQTFGEDDQIAATATEVNARVTRSDSTRGKKWLYWRGPLPRLMRTALEIDVAKFGTRDVTPLMPAVTPADGVPPNPEATARTLQMIKAAEAASIETRVKMFNPKLEKAEVDAEVKRIKEETGAAPVVEPGSTATGHGVDTPHHLTPPPTSVEGGLII